MVKRQDQYGVSALTLNFVLTLNEWAYSHAKLSLKLRKNKCKHWSIESMTKVNSLIKKNSEDRNVVLEAAIRSDAFCFLLFTKPLYKIRGSFRQFGICA